MKDTRNSYEKISLKGSKVGAISEFSVSTVTEYWINSYPTILSGKSEKNVNDITLDFVSHLLY